MEGSWENWNSRLLLSIRKSLRLPDCSTYIRPPSLRQHLLILIKGMVLLGAFSWIFYHSLFPGLAAAVPFGLWFYRGQWIAWNQKNRRRLRGQFKEAAQLLSSSLLSGYAVENAMQKVYGQLVTMWGSRSEIASAFKRMQHQMSVGISVEQVWMDFAEESGLEEIREFAEAFYLAKRSGASLPMLLGKSVLQIEQKLQTESQIETQITAKRSEQRIMNLMPAAILLYVGMTSPEFVELLYTTWTGRGVMTVCLLCYLLAYSLAEKILNQV